MGEPLKVRASREALKKSRVDVEGPIYTSLATLSLQGTMLP